MEDREKIEELIELIELIELNDKKVKLLEELKDFVTKSDFDKINNWLDTIGKSEIFFVMLEFSKDASMSEYLKIVEAYYKHNY